jgi:hypothetical protein
LLYPSLPNNWQVENPTERDDDDDNEGKEVRLVGQGEEGQGTISISNILR